jgi:plasmid stabilization system protein ParE
MPQIRYTSQAIEDLKRLHDFLKTKDPDVARRAVSVIRDALNKVVFMPERFRPVEGEMYWREAVIDFGNSGYVARFQHLQNGDITVARIRHQREMGYPERSHLPERSR